MAIQELIRSKVSRVVSAEISQDSMLHLYRRREDDTVEKMELSFKPFILLTDAAMLNGFESPVKFTQLEGHEVFRCLAELNTPGDFEKAKKFLRQVTGFSPGALNAPYRILNDLVQQALIQLQIRLFQEMDFHQIRRMQIDIETLCDPQYDFSNAQRESDAIVIIGMSDSTGWEQVLSLKNMTEKEMLQTFVKIVRERDPDILEGHNLFRFDLPYLEERAKMHKVKLTLGRDGSIPKKRTSRFNIAERTVNYTRYDIYGRHIADTYHLALFYDAVKRDLDGYGLKNIARHFHVASPDRVYVDASSMNEQWEQDPERTMAYCLDDVRETRAISGILSPSSFYQTQIIPLSYQNCILRGNATKIDAIFLSEYLRCSHSIPAGERARPFSGALTRAFDAGVFDNVMHCDVRSLYPSIILSEKWDPRNDSLGVFRKFLDTLRTFRLEAKDEAARQTDPVKKDYYSSLQSAFKILINSFYGYLGFEQGFLNDFDMAERVTSRGREILSAMLDFLTGTGASVIEMDTDGIYFQPPPGKTVQELKENLARILPTGIDVDFDEHYKRMFSYKSKNYALLKDNGELVISGAALKSRGLEPFQRKYIQSVLLALLNRDPSKIEETDAAFENAIRNREIPIHELAKSETLSDSVENYRRKMQTSSSFRRSAAYELAIRSGREYRQGDQIAFYVTGNKKKVAVVDNSKLLSDANPTVRDENTEYYLWELDELRKKFAPFTESLKEQGRKNEEQGEFHLQ